MNLINNFGLISSLLPFRSIIKNRRKFYRSILLGSKRFNLELVNGEKISLENKEFDLLIKILTITSMATSFKISQNQMKFSFDTKNEFSVPLRNRTYEEENLLELLVTGTKYGANFIVSEDVGFEQFRDKSFRIFKKDNKKIIETSRGIKFFIDSIHPGNTIIETFVNDIHKINSNDDFSDKIVVDVGAECGDTPLYYASLGATVYAFEPIKSNFDAMKRNISLNPSLSSKIIPINAALGEDGELEFFQSPSNPDVGSSFVYNMYGDSAQTISVKGYSLESFLQEFNIKHVDLLKMDCKGCEFFLKNKSLEKVDKIKIEYITLFSSHKLQTLLKFLEKEDFEYFIYRINPLNLRTSNLQSGHIYGIKNKN